MQQQFIIVQDSFKKSLIQDAVSVGVVFFGLWLNQQMGDSFFANCVLGVMLFVFITSGGDSAIKIRGVKALRGYVDGLEEAMSIDDIKGER